MLQQRNFWAHKYVIFLISLSFYFLSSNYYIDYWDSAEFVTSNYLSYPTHPVGAPFYTFISHFIISLFNAQHASFISTLLSGIFSSTTLVFVADIIYILGLKCLTKQINNKPLWASIASVLGTLSLAFSLSYWNSSIETEVYTLSFLLIIVTFWLALLQQELKIISSPQKYTFLLFLLLGISISVHPINIAVIIPIVILKNKKALWIRILLGFMVFIFLYHILFKKLIETLAVIDIHTVNHHILPVNIGSLLGYISVLFFLLIGYFITKKHPKASLILGSLFFYLLGCIFYILPITNTLKTKKGFEINNTPELIKYINAEQFGVDKTPLLYGKTYATPLDSKKPFTNGKKQYYYDAKNQKYVLSNDGNYNRKNYDQKHLQLFPRMYSSKPRDIYGYQQWTHLKKSSTNTNTAPRFTDNINFFINYQVYFLNLRYFLWNFVGKQNHVHGKGTLENGNWISGFSFIDKIHTGEFYSTKNAVYYYGIPLLLGCMGCITLFKNNKLYFYTTLILFLLFGLGISFFVNPTPSSVLVRERDYIITGSFIVFCWWIGLSFIGMINILSKQKNAYKIAVALVLLIVCPLQLFAKNQRFLLHKKDAFHYRVSKIYLESCPENAILFTRGDNTFFPLKYLQNVEGFRTDIKIINFDLLTQPWYIHQLKGNGIHIDLLNKHFENGFPTHFPIIPKNKTTTLNELFTHVNNSKNDTLWNWVNQSYIPSRKLTINSKNWPHTPLVNVPTDTIFQTNRILKTGFMAKHEFAFWNILKNNASKQPICFTHTSDHLHFNGLKNSTIQKGLIGILTNQKAKMGYNSKLVNTQKSDALLNSLNITENTFLTHENREVFTTVIRPQYYFIAQNYIEHHQPQKALKILDTLFKVNNQQVPYKQYAFALGKLYYRCGTPKKGTKILRTVLNNYQERINKYIHSKHIPFPFINAEELKTTVEHYQQMLQQTRKLDLTLFKKQQKYWLASQKEISNWYHKNSNPLN